MSTPAVPPRIDDPVERVLAAEPLPDNPATDPATDEELEEVAQPDPDFTEPVDVDAPTGDEDDFDEVPESEIDVNEENYESLLPAEDDEEGIELVTDGNADVLSDEDQAAYDDEDEPEPQDSYLEEENENEETTP